MAGSYAITARVPGETLTAAKWNADHQAHINGREPKTADDYSRSQVESRAQVSPATLATSLAGELDRLRFDLAGLAGELFWDQARIPLQPVVVSAAETTTISTVAVDVKTISGLSIGTGDALVLLATLRKTAGGADRAAVGLKVNATVVLEAVLPTTAWSSAVNQAEDGFLFALVWARKASYLAGALVAFAGRGVSAQLQPVTVALPNATITSVAIRGKVETEGTTMGVAEAVVYQLVGTI